MKRRLPMTMNVKKCAQGDLRLKINNVKRRSTTRVIRKNFATKRWHVITNTPIKIIEKRDI